MNTRKHKLTAIVLAALMVLYAFPLYGIAEDAIASESIPIDETDILEESVFDEAELLEEDAEPMILYEDETLRTEDTKHYRMTDGSFTAVKFDDDVHYEKDGKWEDIDNSLVLDPSSTTDNPVYRNFAGNVLFRFVGDPSDGKVSAEYDGYGISFELIDLPAPDVGLQPVPKPGDQVEVMSAGNEELAESEVEIIIDETPASEVEESVVVESEEPVEPGVEVSEPETALPVEETTEGDTESVSEPETIQVEDSETLEPDEASDQNGVGEDTTTEPNFSNVEPNANDADTTTAVPETTEPDATSEAEGTIAELVVEEPEPPELSESLISVNPEIDETLPMLPVRSFEIEIVNPGKGSAEIMTFAEATAESKVVTKQEEFTTFTLDQAFESVKSSSFINFTDPTDDFTISYNLSGNTLKENIIVNTKTDEYTYKFALNLVGLVPALMEDGSVSLNNTEGESIFTIPAPYMYDAENEYSSNVAYTLTGNATNGYVLTITANPEWINAEDRPMPVVIDPMVTLTKYGITANSDITTKYYSVGHGESGSGYGNVFLGYDSSGAYAYSGYFRVNSLPTLPANCVPVDAKIYLAQRGYSAVGLSSFKVTAHRITSNTTDAPWYHNYDVEALDYEILSADTNNEYAKWEITPVARDWYNGTVSNLGIVLRNVDQNMDGSSCAKATFTGYSNVSDDPNSQPKFVVTYLNTVGIESLYDYISQNIGGAGSGYVRVRDSEFTLVRPDLSTSGTAMSFTLSHIYNGAYSNQQFTQANGVHTLNYSQMKVGIGWKLNVQQTIVETHIDDVNGNRVIYHIYTDEDGTEHYFYNDPSDDKENKEQGKEDNVYIDEEGLNLTLTVSNGISELKNDKDDKYTFVNGYLYKIEDANGNFVQINYSNVSGGVLANNAPSVDYNRIASITQTIKGQAAKTVATFEYNNGYISRITDESGKVNNYYYGAIGNLYNITHSGGNVARYYYDDSNYRMIRAYDAELGYGIDYTLDSEAVSNFVEFTATYSTSGTIGTPTYGARYYIECNGGKESYVTYVGNDRKLHTTAEPSYDDIVTTYLFDDYGRTVNSYSANSKSSANNTSYELYGTSVVEYTPKGVEPAKTDNKISAQTSTGKLSANYLSDPGMETDSNVLWRHGQSNGTSVLSEEGARTGNQGAVLTNSSGTATGTNVHVYQTLYLQQGTYTFSAYVKVSSITDILPGGGVRLRAVHGSTVVSESRIIRENTNTVIDDGWERLYVTINAETEGYYAFYVSLVNCTGTVYADDAQLELGSTMSRNNLLGNGVIEVNLNYQPWEEYGTSSFEYSAEQHHNGSRSLKLTSNIVNSQQVYNSVNINSPGGSETFVLGGWGYAYSVPYESDKLDPNYDKVKFKLYAKLNYETGDPQYKSLEFNPDIRGQWQYASRVIVSDRTRRLVSVDVYCYYAANNGSAYFDDIVLIKEAVQTYAYDENGKLKSVTSSDKADADSYTYDGADLMSSTSASGVKFDYEYRTTGNTHLVTKVTNDNVASTIDYDAAGNTVGTVLASTSNTGFAKMQTSATYKNNNYVLTTTDENGITTTYEYDSSNRVSLIETPISDTGIVTEEETLRTHYGYDSADRNTLAYVSHIMALNYTYASGNLTKIKRTGFYNGTQIDQEYYFVYDAFGNRTATLAGNQTLATYSYDPGNGRLIKMTYGNGIEESYGYDNLDRVISISYNNTEFSVDGVRYRFTYNGDGTLATSEDVLYDYITYYEYDGIGRIVSQRKYSTLTGDFVEGQRYDYDSAGRVSKVIKLGKYTDTTETYTYDEADGSLKKLYTVHTDVDALFNYTYDALKRLSSKSLAHHAIDDKTLITNYSYKDIEADKITTSRIDEIKYVVKGNSSQYFRRFGYEYDSAGNISQTYTGSNENLTRYYYDKMNQLVLEMNGYSNETYYYTYDTYGNIRSKKIYSTVLFADYEDFSENGHLFYTDTINYGYTNSNFKDLLTSYDGNAIEHDEIGNPLTHFGATGPADLYWDEGRNLVWVSSTTCETVYDYNENGLRIKKDFVTGDSHYYHYSGGQLVSESWGNKRLEFLYDEAGIYGVYYTNGSSSQVFYFIKNLQGDVVEIVDQNMNRVATYAYDAWGRVLYVKNANGVEITDTTHIGYVNPVRYRSYYYDNETGFYYLQSRYYDPVVGRFINADGLISTGQDFFGFNMFAYCANNPVMYTDVSGTMHQMHAGGGSSSFLEEYRKNNPKQEEKNIFEVVYDYWSIPTIFEHYGRNKNNIEFPNKYDADFFEGWDDSVSANCHQFSAKNRDNIKYISPDGKYEAIYDANGILVTDPRDVGTYNYVSPLESELGHGIKDVIPWILYGNSLEDETEIPERLCGFLGIYLR